MQHQLKTQPEDWMAIARGEKTCEARKNDRDFGVGDTLALWEWIPAPETEPCNWQSSGQMGTYTGRVVQVWVKHIVEGRYGLPPDLAIMSIELLWPKPPDIELPPGSSPMPWKIGPLGPSVVTLCEEFVATTPGEAPIILPPRSTLEPTRTKASTTPPG